VVELYGAGGAGEPATGESALRWVAGIVGVGLLALVLWDAFETVVLPRRINRRFRLTRLFYRGTWLPFAALARRVRPLGRREALLSFYGPLSLLFLTALWAAGLVVAFGLLHFALASRVALAGAPSGLAVDLYFSGTTFFTLGLGDASPVSWRSRALTIVEGGMGFGFLALVIGYFPVTYSAFSRRETDITLLDARAGSPPSAAELLRRHQGPEGEASLETLLHEWEHWAAEVLETHLSYPLLAYFRSQHTNESWLSALTTLLDASALMIVVGVKGPSARQARLTFAMARHAVVDLAQVFSTPPRQGTADRLPAPVFARLRSELEGAGLALGADSEQRLSKLRRMYEPYAEALSRYLLQPLPEWHYETRRRDNWQASAWDATAPDLEHF
jgi:Ion channel